MLQNNLLKLFCLFLLLINIPTAFTKTVDAVYFNPKPLDGDVFVSMPCDLSMVFRKVYTSKNTSNKLSDYSFIDGSENATSITQKQNQCYVQGSFKDENGYYYLISKYELNVAQYLALTQKKCPTLNLKSRFPVVNISYLDALNATQSYSMFMQKAKDVPVVDKVKAFAVLPSSCEWSFAQRGGLAVSKSELESEHSGIKGLIDDYAFYSSPTSANGKVQLPGLKKPNPLGLYDMLGNVSEMMFDRFYVAVEGRSHGQLGGITVRGGSYLTPKSKLVSSLRTERSFYDNNGQPLKSKDLGVRFLLSAPIITSISEAKKLNQEIKNQASKADTSKSNDQDLIDRSNMNKQTLALSKIETDDKTATNLKRRTKTTVKQQPSSTQTPLSQEINLSDLDFDNDDVVASVSDEIDVVRPRQNNDNQKDFDYIDSQHAEFYLNEFAKVCGQLKQVKFINKKKMAFLNLDNTYPYQSFTIVLKGKVSQELDFQYDLFSLVDRKVCAIGKIESYKQLLEIVVTDKNKFSVISVKSDIDK